MKGERTQRYKKDPNSREVKKMEEEAEKQKKKKTKARRK